MELAAYIQHGLPQLRPLPQPDGPAFVYLSYTQITVRQYNKHQLSPPCSSRRRPHLPHLLARLKTVHANL
jgi:hypothetical protein